MKIYKNEADVNNFFTEWCSEEKEKEIKEIAGDVTEITEMVPYNFADTEANVVLYVFYGSKGAHAFLSDNQVNMEHIGFFDEAMNDMTYDDEKGYTWPSYRMRF